MIERKTFYCCVFIVNFDRETKTHITASRTEAVRSSDSFANKAENGRIACISRQCATTNARSKNESHKIVNCTVSQKRNRRRESNKHTSSIEDPFPSLHPSGKKVNNKEKETCARDNFSDQLLIVILCSQNRANPDRKVFTKDVGCKGKRNGKRNGKQMENYQREW